ncbi:MAG: shikimate kinase, partial [Flavobacteriaceae bacterium]|nr:shikimate kinase [Flavobacteriaceae bacterium]
MIIVLMGYMGSGKSTIGRQLAEVLNYRFVDLDDYIVEKEKTTINEIFKKRGEIYFRKIEASNLKEVITSSDNIILALGGGTPCYGTNLELLLQNEKVKSLYLKLSIPSLVERLFKERG